MQISILIPTYNRSEQLAEAIASVAAQDRSLIKEVLIGDNSGPKGLAENRAVVAASPLAPLIEHIANDPPSSNFPNQWALARRAASSHILFLHDDDHLSPGGLAALVAACESETDSRVKVWFGRNYVMDDSGRIDMERTRENDRQYGKDGPSEARPVWRWCLKNSLPPNCALLVRADYLQHMEGPRDGNVGDWGLWVRMANSGAWGRFIADYLWSYREQAASQTASGRGLDVHRCYELGLQLKVDSEGEAQKTALLSRMAMVATLRYLRDGERRLALQCMASSHWHWRDRFSLRGLAIATMLVTPRPFWLWSLRYRA
jgi:glycosyltransferase involved in cell wall biosynthesis